jgi:hypothetical protein
MQARGPSSVTGASKAEETETMPAGLVPKTFKERRQRALGMIPGSNMINRARPASSVPASPRHSVVSVGCTKIAGSAKP